MKALVRRRKWVRTRACHSKDIHDQLTSKVETLNSTRACIEGSMRQQQKNLTRVKKYELARVRAYETAFGEFNEDMDRVGKVMRDYMIKLARMKTFLLERSAIEREYSQKLKQLSTKWIDAGDTTSTSTRNRNTSVDSSRESFMLASDRSPTDIGSTTDISAQKPRTGFFYLINSTSLEVGENLEGFSELLSDSLCKGTYCIGSNNSMFSNLNCFCCFRRR